MENNFCPLNKRRTTVWNKSKANVDWDSWERVFNKFGKVVKRIYKGKPREELR